MSETKFVEIKIQIEESTLERLKGSLENREHRRSGTQAIEEAINYTIASHGAVFLDESLRREIASRAGTPVPKDAKAVLDCFEAATKVTPYTVHVDIDPGVASEILGHAHDQQLSFQEMVKQLIEQSVLDRYLYSVTSYRSLFFAESDWKQLVTELGGNGKGPRSGKELVGAVRNAKATAEQALEQKLAAEEKLSVEPQGA